MNEARYLAVTGQVMSDNTELMPIIHIKEAWLLISGLQLASRHPQVSGLMKQQWRDIADQFAEEIIRLHPEAETVIDIGWDETHDVEAEELSQEPPQPCTGCGEIGTCRCAELDDCGHLLNVSPEELEQGDG